MRRRTGVLVAALAVFGAWVPGASAFGEGSAVAVTPDGLHVYLNTPNGTLALARTAGSGELTYLSRVDNGAAKSMEISPDGRFVYVAAQPNAPGVAPPAIGAFRRDSGTGTLTSVSVQSPRSRSTGDITLSPDGRQLYLIAVGAERIELLAFDRDVEAGTLARPSVGATIGGNRDLGLAASSDGKWVHAGSKLYRRASDGGLTEVPDPCEACGATTLLLGSRDTRLYSGPFGGPQAYSRDVASSELTAARSAECCRAGYAEEAPGGGMALHGSTVYALDTHAGLLHQSRVTGEGLEDQRVYRQPRDAVGGLQAARSLAVSPDGRHVYVAARPEGAATSTIAVFRRDPPSGDLAFASLWEEPAPQFGPAVDSPDITIDDGAAFTNDPRVEVRLTGSSFFGSGGVELSNDGGFGPAARRFPWRSDRTYSWQLDSTGPERLPKTVYARNPAGSGRIENDQIVLDERHPRVVSARRTQARKVRVKVRDRISGVSRVQIAAKRRRPGRWRPYSARKRYSVGLRRRYVRVRDRAGNRSRWRLIPASRRRG